MAKKPLDFGGIEDTPLDAIAPEKTTAPSRPVVPTAEPAAPVEQGRGGVIESTYVRKHVRTRRQQNASLSMRGPADVLDRFRDMAAEADKSHWLFLEIIMDHYEATKK